MTFAVVLLALLSGYAEAARVIQLEAGDQHNCALFDNKKVKCWGRNGYGQLGLGDTRNRGNTMSDITNLPYVDFGVDTPVELVEGGGTQSCAVFVDGSLRCWGNNSYGQAGTGTTDNSVGDSTADLGMNMKAVDLGAGVRVTSVSTGFHHTCALLSSGMVKCFGRNGNGQLGLGDTRDRGRSPADLGDALPALDLGGIKAVALSSGDYFTCALLANGQVKCWGENNGGQHGQGDTRARGGSPGQMGAALASVPLGTGLKAIKISAGYRFVCAILADRTVKCWGQNNGGIGLGSTASVGAQPGQMGDELPRVDLEPGLAVENISCGSFHCCASFAGVGTAKCFGEDQVGCLGLGETGARGDQKDEMGLNLPFVDLGSFTSVRAVQAGYEHSCAVTENGQVKCWGRNDDGRLGQGDSRNRGQRPTDMGEFLPPIPFE